jgi:hypothetical protein
MILEILPADGLGHGEAIVMHAAQVVVRQDNGTPVAVVAHYGPENSYSVGSVAHDDEEFHRILRTLGINETVVVQHLEMRKPPPEAILVASPKTKR